MTVKELIQELTKYPSTATVLIGVPDFPDRGFVNYDLICSVKFENDDSDEAIVTINI